MRIVSPPGLAKIQLNDPRASVIRVNNELNNK